MRIVSHGPSGAAPGASDGDRLDVCMTALRRPELLELTLESFSRRVFPAWRHIRLIANIDPLGDPADLDRTIELMQRHSHESLIRVTDRGNFTDAVRWCWQQASSPRVLHLEDDWLCLRRVDRAAVERTLGREGVGAVRLYLHRVPLRRRKRDIGFSLNPCFFRRDWIRALADRLDDGMDPEKQVRWKQGRCAEVADTYRTVMYGFPGYPPVVMDIGRDWRAEQGLHKHLVDGQAVWTQGDPLEAGPWRRARWAMLRLRARFP